MQCIAVLGVGICLAEGGGPASKKALVQPVMGILLAAPTVFAAGTGGQGQGGEFVVVHVGDGAEPGRVDGLDRVGRRVADKQLPAPQTRHHH